VGRCKRQDARFCKSFDLSGVGKISGKENHREEKGGKN
jgi:hypothetical protein